MSTRDHAEQVFLVDPQRGVTIAVAVQLADDHPYKPPHVHFHGPSPETDHINLP